MVNDFEVIHMGGRTYNPTLGRFMQADPFIQQPGNLQSYNRYAYVQNNPMSYTDPSGYFIAGLLKSAVRSVLKLVPQNVGNFMISLGAKFCGPWAGACAAAATYEFSRAHGMSRTGALRAAAYAFGKIGEYYGDAGAENLMDAVDSGSDFSHLTSFGGNYLTGGQIAGQIAAHAVTGGIVSSIGGGKFGHGFFSAGVTKGLGTPISAHFDQGMISGTITQMVIGGTASVIAGGKFANGARTAAYQALFNYFSKSVFSMVKAAQETDEHKKKIQLIQSLNLNKSADRQALAMLYCTAGYDSGECSSFGKIAGNVDYARDVRMKVLIELNVVAARNIGAATGEIATSFYKDALGIPISRGGCFEKYIASYE